MPTPALPQYCPTPRELDDLELLAVGALAPTVGVQRARQPGHARRCPPTWSPQAAAAVGAVELVDPEGLPLARVSVPGRRRRAADPRAVRPVPAPLPHPGRDSASGTPAAPSSRSSTRSPRPQIAALSRGRAARCSLPLVGHGTPELSADGPDPRHPGRGRPAARRRGRRGPARRRTATPTSTTPSASRCVGELRRPATRSIGVADDPTARLPAGDRRDRRPRPARARPTRAWSSSSPACPAAASRRWPGR